MSPRAAWRLEQLGFEDVHDYGPGKSDWTAAGLPTEGEEAGQPTAGTAAERVPTCAVDSPLDLARNDAGDAAVTVVVGDRDVVVGELRWSDVDVHGEDTAGDVMRPGPVTVRYDSDPSDLAERMRRAEAPHVLVTDPDGRLQGAVTVDRLHAVLHDSARD